MYSLLVLFALLVSGCMGVTEREIQHQAWYNSLTLEQRAIEDQRRHERAIAAIQAYGAMNQNRQVFSPMAPLTLPQTYQPIMNEQPRRRTNCTSNIIGNQVYTNCY